LANLPAAIAARCARGQHPRAALAVRGRVRLSRDRDAELSRPRQHRGNRGFCRLGDHVLLHLTQ
jgi:hypothetical protein